MLKNPSLHPIFFIYDLVL